MTTASKAAAPQLLCDEMLALLARWLRAAGYDTALSEPGTPDAALLDVCAAEGRVLISRDRRLVSAAQNRARAVLLGDHALDDHACTLAGRLGIDWTRAPFTRCLVDNSLLRRAHGDRLEHVPPPFRDPPTDIRTCPQCARVYWPGGHVRRMRERLDAWRTRC